MVFTWKIFSEWETVFQKESLHFHTVLGKDFLFQYQVADFYLIFPWRCMCLITQTLGQSLIPHYACDIVHTKAISKCLCFGQLLASWLQFLQVYYCTCLPNHFMLCQVFIMRTFVFLKIHRKYLWSNYFIQWG